MKKFSNFQKFLILFSLAFLFSHGLYSAWINSVTVDEYVHLPVALSILETGDLQLDHAGSPPLARCLQALPVLLFKPAMIYGEKFCQKDVYGFSWAFMVNNFMRYHKFFFYARFITIIFTVCFAIFFLKVISNWYDVETAVAGLLLFCFNPGLLAHSALMTVDMLFTIFFFFAVWAFIEFLRNAHLLSALLSGIFTGAACLSKFPGIILLPIFFVLTLFSVIFQTSPSNPRTLASLNPLLKKILGFFAVIFISFFILNAGYKLNPYYEFSGIWKFKNYPMKSNLIKKLESSPIGNILVPLPYLYVDAFDHQLYKKEKIFDYYFIGKLSKTGWKSYFIAGWILKTPIPLILFVIIALFRIFRKLEFKEIMLWIPPIVLFSLFSFYVRVNLGIRYLLPAEPFLIILSAKIVKQITQSQYILCNTTSSKIVSQTVKSKIRYKFSNFIAAGLMFWYILCSFQTFGNALSYFNEFAGGPENGHKYLLDSNLDWGQNLIRLRNFMKQEDIKKLKLYNYGLVSPSIYGIKHDWLPCGYTKGIIAVSTNYLHGVDPFQRRPAECFNWLFRFKPYKKIGGGLFVYNIQ